jgi:hypothetical protein
MLSIEDKYTLRDVAYHGAESLGMVFGPSSVQAAMIAAAARVCVEGDSGAVRQAAGRYLQLLFDAESARIGAARQPMPAARA